MKKLLAILLLSIGTAAFAQHGHYGYRYHHHHHSGGWGWVAPALIGGAVVYAATRPPVVVQPQPVVVPPPVYVQANCTPWTEVRNADGSVTITRTCTQ